MVLTFRNQHNFTAQGRANINSAAFEALRKGGVYGVVNQTGKWELPLPATYIVTRDRTIGYEFIDVDFRARCCPDALIEEVKPFC